jgi:hypothetical protein
MSSSTDEGPVRERVKRTPPLLAEHVDRFLEHVTSGDTRQEAARKVQVEWDAKGADGERCHATSSRFRRLYFADEDFRRRYEAALEDSGQSEDETGGKRKRLEALERERLVRRAFDEYVERALDPERGKRGSSNRALQNLLVLMHETFRPFLEARVHKHVHSGAVGLFAQPVIDTGKWSLEEQREFVELERRRELLLAKARPDGDDVLEGEVVELPPLLGAAVTEQPA